VGSRMIREDSVEVVSSGRLTSRLRFWFNIEKKLCSMISDLKSFIEGR